MSAIAPAPRKQFPWWIYWTILALLFLFAVFPLAPVAVAAWVADANGCTINEGFNNTCMVNGAEWGETLHEMGMFGWWFLATAMVAGMLFWVWVAALVIHYLVHANRKAPAP